MQRSIIFAHTSHIPLNKGVVKNKFPQVKSDFFCSLVPILGAKRGDWNVLDLVSS